MKTFFNIIAFLSVVSLAPAMGTTLVKPFDDNHQLKLEDLKPVKVLFGGSGGVVLLSDPKTLRKYTLKCSANEDAFKEEVLADSLYRALGVSVPDFALYQDVPTDLFMGKYACANKGTVRLAEYIEEDTIDPALVKKKLAEHFVVDAFLSNWDITVEGLKNVIATSPRNKGDNFDLYRIDNGGSLRYRALGTLKDTSKGWSPSWVSEIETLRDSKINPEASRIYSVLSDQEIQKQATDLVLKTDVLFKQLEKMGQLLHIKNTDFLQTNLALRLQDLFDRFVDPLKANEIRAADRYARAKPGFSSAGVFVYAVKDGKPLVLLGKRKRSDVWGIFGGDSDLEDEFLFETAKREAEEESHGLVLLTESELNNAPSHDYVTGKNLFRTYFVKHSYIPSADFNKFVGTGSEQTEFMWVSMDDLIKSVLNGERVYNAFYKDWTTKIGDTILYPPFFHSLTHNPALELINEIRMGTPTLTRTMMVRATGTDKPGPITYVAALKKDRALHHYSKVHDTKLRGALSDIGAGDKIRLSKQIADAILAKSRANAALKKDSVGFTESEKKSFEDAQKLPYTQSESHFMVQMGDQYQKPTVADKDDQLRKKLKSTVETYLEDFSAHCKTGCTREGDTYSQSLADALESEIKSPGYHVFYHGTSSFVGFMYDVYTEFRKQLMILGGNDLVALRASNKGFKNFVDADDFYKIFASSGTGNVNNRTLDLGNYADFGLSVNPFLFGSDGILGSETYRLFFLSTTGGYVDADKLFKSLTQPLGQDFEFKKYNNLYEKYFSNPNMNLTKSEQLDQESYRKLNHGNNGRLFQIFAHPAIIDRVGYLAISGGERLNAKKNNSYYNSLDRVISGLRKDPIGGFDDLKDAYDNMKNLTINDLQVRLFLDPKYFHDPKYVKIKSYNRFPLKDGFENEYRRLLQDYVSNDIALWLSRQITVDPSVYGKKDQKAFGTEIQRLYNEVYKGMGMTPTQLHSLERTQKTEKPQSESQSSGYIPGDYDRQMKEYQEKMKKSAQ